MQPIPYLEMQRLVEGMILDKAYNYWKPAFVTALADELIDALVAHADRAQSPYSVVVVELYGGAARRRPSG